MPRSGKEITIVGGPRGGGDRDQFGVSVDRTGDTEDVDDRSNRKERTGFGRATEQAVMVPLTKVKKQFNLRRKREKINRIPSSSSSSFAANANDDNGNTSSSLSSGKRVGTDSDSSCFCFKKPQTLDSSPTPESSTSDPNDPKFTSDMLKTLMQNNDFYSEDCNPHTC